MEICHKRQVEEEGEDEKPAASTAQTVTDGSGEMLRLNTLWQNVVIVFDNLVINENRLPLSLNKDKHTQHYKCPLHSVLIVLQHQLIIHVFKKCYFYLTHKQWYCGAGPSLCLSCILHSRLFNNTYCCSGSPYSSKTPPTIWMKKYSIYSTIENIFNHF